MKKCKICERQLKLYKKSNISQDEISSFAYASRKIPEYMHWDLYECESCRVLYSDCPISVDDIFEKYLEAAYDSSEEADYASITYIKYLKCAIPNFPKDKVLDIGTGNGSYLLELRNNGAHKTVGVEPSKEPINQANDLIRNDIINSPFKTGMFQSEEFDMVSLFQTVEHIPDPLSTFREIERILKPQGVFYVICHDYRSVVNTILGMKSPIYDIEHLQIFSQKSIARLMKKVGFNDVRVFSIKNKYPLKYWVRLFPAPKIIKKKLILFFDGTKIGSIMIGINVGNIGVIARK